MRPGLGIAIVAVGGIVLLIFAMNGWPMAEALREVRAGTIDPIIYEQHHYEVFGFRLPHWGCWLVVATGVLAGLGLIGCGLRICGDQGGR